MLSETSHLRDLRHPFTLYHEIHIALLFCVRINWKRPPEGQQEAFLFEVSSLGTLRKKQLSVSKCSVAFETPKRENPVQTQLTCMQIWIEQG